MLTPNYSILSGRLYIIPRVERPIHLTKAGGICRVKSHFLFFAPLSESGPPPRFFALLSESGPPPRFFALLSESGPPPLVDFFEADFLAAIYESPFIGKAIQAIEKRHSRYKWQSQVKNFAFILEQSRSGYFFGKEAGKRLLSLNNFRAQVKSPGLQLSENFDPGEFGFADCAGCLRFAVRPVPIRRPDAEQMSDEKVITLSVAVRSARCVTRAG